VGEVLSKFYKFLKGVAASKIKSSDTEAILGKSAISMGICGGRVKERDGIGKKL